MRIDTSSWREFKVADLGFKIHHGSRIKKTDRIDGDIPFITAGKELQGYVGKIGNECETYDAPLTVDMFGNCFFQNYTCAGDDNIYFFVNNDLSEYQKLFISVSIFSKTKDKYSYEDQFRQGDAEKLSIKLPVTPSGQPDYKYMEEYMKNVEHIVVSSITNLLSTKQEKKKIDVDSWGDFKVEDLFDIRPTKSYKMTNAILIEENGKNPVVVNSSYNNGIGGYTNQENTEKAGTITFSDTTTSDAIFYQNQDFVGYSHVQGMYPTGNFKDKWTKHSLFFFMSVFKNKASLMGFDYGNKFTRKIAEKILIKLPITSSGEPDWFYMENYVKDILNFSNKKIDSLNRIQQKQESIL